MTRCPEECEKVENEKTDKARMAKVERERGKKRRV